jgi:hypothetical protein
MPARLLTTIQAQGILVLVHCCFPANQCAVTLVVADKPQRARSVLEQAGIKCRTNPVVLVRAPPQPAIAARLGMHLTAAQIGIHYCYTTQVEATAAHVVFKTTDDDRAVRVLEACALRQDQWTKFQVAQHS